jgi:DNA-binding NarL/FixJ family response regulator
VIVDDNTSFLDAARRLLEAEGLDVVATVTTSEDALEAAIRLRPDVMLVDVMLGEESGFALAQRLNDVANAVVMISTHSAADLEDLLIESPARGFVAKTDLSAPAIRRLLEAS